METEIAAVIEEGQEATTAIATMVEMHEIGTSREAGQKIATINPKITLQTMRIDLLPLLLPIVSMSITCNRIM